VRFSMGMAHKGPQKKESPKATHFGLILLNLRTFPIANLTNLVPQLLSKSLNVISSLVQPCWIDLITTLFQANVAYYSIRWDQTISLTFSFDHMTWLKTLSLCSIQIIYIAKSQHTMPNRWIPRNRPVNVLANQTLLPCNFLPWAILEKAGFQAWTSCYSPKGHNHTLCIQKT
jgi:hypothetical protein